MAVLACFLANRFGELAVLMLQWRAHARQRWCRPPTTEAGSCGIAPPPCLQLEQLYSQVRVVAAPLLSGAGVKGKVNKISYEGAPTACQINARAQLQRRPLSRRLG